MAKLSATIITLNEEVNILRTLQSVLPVVDEVVVVDSMSKDRTAEICREAGCRVILKEFDGYGATKQFAVDQASHDWILSVDADEVLSAGLQQELREMFREGGKIDAGQESIAGFRIPRSLSYMGRILKHSGTGKERIVRLFNRKQGAFTLVAVHEEISVNGNCGELKGGIIHYSYRDIRHHLDKINTYTSLAAQDYHAKGKRFSRIWPAMKFPASFITFYFFKGGILDGYPGFMWSLLAAVYGSLKVAKTIELNNKK